MDCKTAIKSVRRFMDDDLEIEDLRDFLNHVEECPECKEELTIEILVKEGINSLESGSLFDLSKAYANKIADAEHVLKVREYLSTFYHILIGMVCVGIISVVLLLLLIP